MPLPKNFSSSLLPPPREGLDGKHVSPLFASKLLPLGRFSLMALLIKKRQVSRVEKNKQTSSKQTFFSLSTACSFHRRRRADTSPFIEFPPSMEAHFISSIYHIHLGSRDDLSRFWSRSAKHLSSLKGPIEGIIRRRVCWQWKLLERWLVQRCRFHPGSRFVFYFIFLSGGTAERPGNWLTIPGIKVRLCGNPGLGFGKLH